MSKILSSRLLAIFLLLILLAACSQKEVAGTYHNVFPIKDLGVLKVKIYNGQMTIVRTDKSEIDITGDIIGQASTFADAEDLVLRTKINVVQTGNQFSVETQTPSGLMLFSSVVVNYEIKVPQTTRVLLETHNGSISVKGVDGNIEALTHNGSITLTEAKGKVDCESHNGSIQINGAPTQIVAKSHNGNIDVTLTGSSLSDDSSITTHNGSITVSFPKEFSAELELSSLYGMITSELAEMKMELNNKSTYTRTLKEGGRKLRIETNSGSIKLRNL